jgi:hypothetical protein
VAERLDMTRQHRVEVRIAEEGGHALV